MNNVNLLGYLKNKKDIILSKNGNYILNISILVPKKLSKEMKEQYKIENKSVYYYFNVVLFGNIAKYVDNYCEIGQKLLITGYLNQNTYISKENEQKYAVDIVGNEVILLDNKNVNYYENIKDDTIIDDEEI